MNDLIIETFDLSKFYYLKGKKKYIKALDNINISIKRGEIFGLLGPNGAGKTTFIQILTTLLHPTSGYALIDGYHLLKNSKIIKLKVALMLEYTMLYYRITAYDNLKFFCKLYSVKNYKQKIYDMAKLFGIENWLNQYVENLSSGTKTKLALCRTLLLERDILFLDEPTIGLDVKAISFIIDILKKIEGTIIITSQDMSVVEKLCDRIAFINDGKILKIGTQEDIKTLAESEIKIEISLNHRKQELITELHRQDFINSITENQQNRILVRLKGRAYYKKFLKIVSQYDIIKIKEFEPSLEDIFMKIY